MEKEYKNLGQFYPFYLGEHSKTGNRIMHFIGTTLFLTCVGLFLFRGELKWLALGPVLAYGFAWFGHFFLEKNRPATFQYPILSLISDFKLYFDILRGKEKLIMKS